VRVYLGLDLGTSAVKALLAGEDGTVVASGRAPCRVDVPAPGRAEAQPEEWLAAAHVAVRDALAQAGSCDVVAIGFSGQMHGVVLCDEQGGPVRPAILWADARAAAEAERWERAGNPPAPGFAGPIVAWLAAHEPESLRRARWALQPKDWLRMALGAPAATEPSDASATLLWDLAADCWAREDALLAPVCPSAAPAGELARPLGGIPAGTPLVHGAADTAAALLVAGGRMLNVGTGAQLAQPAAHALPSVAAPACHRFRAAGPGWYALAAVQNAGLAVDWARRVLGDGPAAVGAGPLFVPHLTGARTPLLDASARGAWTVLSLATDAAALRGSVLEGVAFAVRWARDALVAEAGPGDGPLRLLGGGSLTPAYAQALADALGESLEVTDVADASALGAARLAGAPATPSRVTGEVLPRAEAAALAAERFAAWRAVALGVRGGSRDQNRNVRGCPRRQRPSSP
jgi:xylulokinase